MKTKFSQTGAGRGIARFAGGVIYDRTDLDKFAEGQRFETIDSLAGKKC